MMLCGIVFIAMAVQLVWPNARGAPILPAKKLEK